MQGYYGLMFGRGFNDAVPGTRGVDDYRIGPAVHEQFIGLVGLKTAEFVRSDNGPGDGYMLVMTPGGFDHFEEGGRFSSDYQGAGFTLFRKKYLGCSGCDHALTTLRQFAGKGIHGGCFAARPNDGDEGLRRQVNEVRE